MPAFTINQRATVKQVPISSSPKTTPSPGTTDRFSQSPPPKPNLVLSTPPPRKWPPFIKPSLKWVGRNHAYPPNQPTPLPLASPASPLSQKKTSPWISAHGGSAAMNLNNNSTTTGGIRAVTIGQTTTPSTTHQSTMKPTDQSMLVQQPNYLKLLPFSGPAAFFS
jgi:hypothetical protein